MLKDGQAEAYYHSEGRVLLADGTPRFQYQISDHLGNLAVFFEDKAQDGIILTEATASDPTKVEVLQRHFYYPFGLNFEGHWVAQDEAENKYQYNGKELAKDLGLGWYFYGARMHDPAIGRFTGVDPIADRFAWVSSYNYAEDSPIRYIDLWGLQAASAEIAMDRDVKELMEGKITRQEYMLRAEARFYGGIIGLGGVGLGGLVKRGLQNIFS